jgi:hypothetical protein
MHLSGPNNVIGQAGQSDVLELGTLVPIQFLIFYIFNPQKYLIPLQLAGAGITSLDGIHTDSASFFLLFFILSLFINYFLLE